MTKTLVEVKFGNSNLSKKQKRTKKIIDDIKSKQIILSNNVKDAKEAEELAKKELMEEGYTIFPTNGIGSDFGARSPKGEYILVEVKFGNSNLSKKQKRTKKIMEQKGVTYMEYRISRKRLEYYKEQKMKQNLKNNFSNANLESEFPGKWLIRVPHSCPNCGLKSSEITSIILNFGLRNMDDGIVREQSWCIECRKFTRRGE